jgi:hypothetical protein
MSLDVWYHWEMEIRIIKEPIALSEVAQMAAEQFGDVIKAVVDVERGIMAIGPEMHAEGETLLMEAEGSKREHVWGINLYPEKIGNDFLEFDSMINLKPAHGNHSRGVEDETIREKLRTIISRLIEK